MFQPIFPYTHHAYLRHFRLCYHFVTLDVVTFRLGVMVLLGKDYWKNAGEGPVGQKKQ